MEINARLVFFHIISKDFHRQIRIMCDRVYGLTLTLFTLCIKVIVQPKMTVFSLTLKLFQTCILLFIYFHRNTFDV